MWWWSVIGVTKKEDAEKRTVKYPCTKPKRKAHAQTHCEPYAREIRCEFHWVDLRIRYELQSASPEFTVSSEIRLVVKKCAWIWEVNSVLNSELNSGLNSWLVEFWVEFQVELWGAFWIEFQIEFPSGWSAESV